jgi:hypothetical protein
MGLWTKQQLHSFIKENKLVTAQNAQNALKNLFAETIQQMLDADWIRIWVMKSTIYRTSKRPTVEMERVRGTSLVSMVNRKSLFHATDKLSLNLLWLRNISPI